MSVEADLRRALGSRAAPVDDALVAELADGSPDHLHAAARHLVVAGGKRLRPAVLLLVAEAVDPAGADADRLPAAVAVELVHTLSLVHDDVVDDDDRRRGVPSVHAAWDEATAIVAGDLLYARAFEVLARADATSGTRLAATGALARACRRLSEGQALDLAFQGRDDVAEADYLDMVSAKTGALFSAAAELGARWAGADEATAAAAAAFGRSLGTAFQLHDDVLDVTGAADVLGKPVGSDLAGGRATLVTIHARRQGVDVSPARLARDGLDALRADLEAAGSLDYAQRRAEGLVDGALGDLEALPRSRARDTLADLARFAVERER